jgi:hypothetical protein
VRSGALLTLGRSLVRIWDTLGEEQILKGEYKVISGKMYVTRSLLLVTQICACSNSGFTEMI